MMSSQDGLDASACRGGSGNLVCQVWLILDNFVLLNMIQRYFQMEIRPLIFQKNSTIPKSLMV